MDQRTCCNLDQFAKALGQDTRQQILRLLQNKEMNVGEMAHLLGLTQPTISYHLSILRKTGLVIPRRSGQHTLYKANQECVIACCMDILNQFKVSYEIQDRKQPK